MGMPLIVMQNPALCAIIQIDVLLVTRKLLLFAQIASLERSSEIHRVFPAIRPVFHAVEMLQVVFCVDQENILLGANVFHVLKIVLCVRML